MRTVAIIPTAGSGERFGSAVPKPLVDLGGEPLVLRTLRVFEASSVVDGIILVVREDLKKGYEDLVARAGLRKVVACVAGGATRTVSVRRGLSAIGPEAEVVIVHDGVRPFVTGAMIAEGVALAKENGAAIAAVPLKPTVKLVDSVTGEVKGTLERARLFEVQTPQVFRRDVIEKAYALGLEATDDAALVEKAGGRVRVFPGSYRNIKITTPEDLLLAQAFLEG
ncbi:MAG: 2-C-methyl-D-erythritol 4-phosphate cytidylyltransferase [Elusimicrobia bacterium]|nr:2-C-methyl-D-erythritol 4-phosphate cytidylyltransferase [Elusimicrobiota bacterium]